MNMLKITLYQPGIYIMTSRISFIEKFKLQHKYLTFRVLKLESFKAQLSGKPININHAYQIFDN